jgi:pyruvate/2-oxoglutarate/acetoin dehydrogenase E1 component
MSYYKELKKSMEYLANDKRAIFLGQAVKYPGTAMSSTLKDIDKKKLLELPVAEEMQMGITIGLVMKGYIPISIFPRWNFLLLSINQLVNHLDKLSYMTNNFYKSKAIIRTSIGSERPLHPQYQHIGDFSYAISNMLTSVKVVKLSKTNQIFNEYKKALKRKESTILVEFGDYYNEK